MMGDHSKEETEYPTSAPVDEDGTVPPALLMHTEEEDILRVYLMILVLFLFLGDEDSGRLLGKREKARRQEQLEKELKVKRWSSCDLEEGEIPHATIDMGIVEEKPVIVLVEDDSSSVDDDDDDDQPGCAICLEHFRDSQLVCEPTNEKCNHSFHKDCMTVWLMRHTRCPICREKYLEKTHLEVEPPNV